MGAIKINTTIKLDGIDELNELLETQQDLLRKLRDNVEAIECVVRTINLSLSIGKATSDK